MTKNQLAREMTPNHFMLLGMASDAKAQEAVQWLLNQPSLPEAQSLLAFVDMEAISHD